MTQKNHETNRLVMIARIGQTMWVQIRLRFMTNFEIVIDYFLN